MDNDNVITLTGDLESLDLDMIDWQSMCYGDRKRSDDACRSKYGVSNTDLYNMLKDDITMEQTIVEGTTMSNAESIDRANKIKASVDMENREGVVIITDWLDDEHPSYSPISLNMKYHKYLSLLPDIRDYSDQYSMNIWGYTVYNMYQKMIDKFNTLDYDRMYNESAKPDTLMEYVSYIKKEYPTKDILAKKILELSCLTGESLYESTVLDKVRTNLSEMNEDVCDYSDDIPTITPYFTPDEMEDLVNTDVDPYDFCINGRPVQLMEDIIKAQLEGNTEELIKLGWNPSVPFTHESAAYARERQIKWFNENKGMQIIDLSNYDAPEITLTEAEKKSKKKPLEPVFLVLVSHKGLSSKMIRTLSVAHYSHVGISLDDSMENIVSYNMHDENNEPKLSLESMKFYQRARDAKCKVMVFFVDHKVKEELRKKIDWFVKNKDKTSFAFSHFFTILLHKTQDISHSLSLVCSQFVDSTLKSCNIDITAKDSSLVTPGDFDKHKGTNKIFTMFTGFCKDYDKKRARRLVNNLLKSDLNPEGLETIPVKEAMESIFREHNLESFFVETGDVQVDQLLSEIRQLLTPEAVITEARPLPVRFGKSGNLFIELPRDLEAEYQEAHKLLLSYNEDNLQGIKHQLARLFFVNSVIEKKLQKMKKGDESYKDFIDLRARVLNDFKKYMKVVQQLEPNFDFDMYMKNSEYYNKTIMVDKYTIRYTGHYIKQIIRHMIV